MKETEKKVEEGKAKTAEAGASGDKIVSKGKTLKSKEVKLKEYTINKTNQSHESVSAHICVDKDCPNHGNLKIRGRVFKGEVIRKFHKRVVIEFERMIYVRKYERYKKSKTKIHARLPVCIEKEINVGDSIKVQECRPLSKMIHFAVIGKVNGGQEK